jgi:cobalt-zinc-cadmium resistance protein CzcA
LFTRLGGEFIPTLDEGDLGLEIYRVVGRNGSGGKNAKTFEEALISLPEAQLDSALGTAEVATDPCPNQVMNSSS